MVGEEGRPSRAVRATPLGGFGWKRWGMENPKIVVHAVFCTPGEASCVDVLGFKYA